MNKHIISLLSLFVLLPSTIYADCTEEEIKNFKKIEDDYKVTYEFNKETKNYTLKFYSPEPNMYDFIIYIVKTPTCKELENNMTECYNIDPGTYDLEIVGQTDSCKNSFKQLTIDLPKYNKYSDDPLCKGIEDFVLCQPTYDKDIEYDDFVSRVNTYRNSLEIVNENDTNQNINKPENKILEYIKNNLFEIIIVAIFVLMVIATIILTAKSAKKSRRLE